MSGRARLPPSRPSHPIPFRKLGGSLALPGRPFRKLGGSLALAVWPGRGRVRMPVGPGMPPGWGQRALTDRHSGLMVAGPVDAHVRGVTSWSIDKRAARVLRLDRASGWNQVAVAVADLGQGTPNVAGAPAMRRGRRGNTQEGWHHAAPCRHRRMPDRRPERRLPRPGRPGRSADVGGPGASPQPEPRGPVGHRPARLAVGAGGPRAARGRGPALAGGVSPARAGLPDPGQPGPRRGSLSARPGPRPRLSRRPDRPGGGRNRDRPARTGAWRISRRPSRSPPARPRLTCARPGAGGPGPPRRGPGRVFAPSAPTPTTPRPSDAPR